MSFDTHKNWFYELHGRFIHLWQWVETAATDTIDGIRVKLPAEYYGNQLIYPNEDISDGLRVEYTAFYEPFVAEALETTVGRVSDTGISFVTSSNYIRITTSNAWSTGNIASGDKIRVIGSASNDGDYTITAIGDWGGGGSPTYTNGQLTVSESVGTTESAGESITIYQIPLAVADASVDESSHVNLNRMLSLAVVDFMKAQVKEAAGDLQGREYFMREFWKKVGDNESNKRLQSIVFPISPFAVK